MKKLLNMFICIVLIFCACFFISSKNNIKSSAYTYKSKYFNLYPYAKTIKLKLKKQVQKKWKKKKYSSKRVYVSKHKSMKPLYKKSKKFKSIKKTFKKLSEGTKYYFCVGSTLKRCKKGGIKSTTTKVYKPSTISNFVPTNTSSGINLKWSAAKYATTYILKFSKTRDSNSLNKMSVKNNVDISYSYLESLGIKDKDIFFCKVWARRAKGTKTNTSSGTVRAAIRYYNGEVDSSAQSSINTGSFNVLGPNYRDAQGRDLQQRMYLLGSIVKNEKYDIVATQELPDDKDGWSAQDDFATATNLTKAVQPVNPSAPYINSVSNGDSKSTIGWQKADSGSGDILYYEYSFSSSSSSDENISWHLMTGTDANSVSFTFTDLINGQIYPCKIRAVTEIGASPESNTVNLEPNALSQLNKLNKLGAGTGNFNAANAAPCNTHSQNVFYDQNKYQILKCGYDNIYKESSHPNDGDTNRYVTYIQFKNLSTGQNFMFYNVHLSNNGNWYAPEHRRMDEIDQMKNETIDPENPNKLPFIIAGDFNSANTEFSNTTMQQMNNYGYLDVDLISQNKSNYQYRSYHGFNTPFVDQERWDHIFISDNFFPLSFNLQYSSPKSYPSDHYSIGSVVKF